jgi:uncharacterized protein (TIGR00730 family)
MSTFSVNTVCVYCASSNSIDPAFAAAASELGECLGRAGQRLVFGGVASGLMKAVADSARRHGGELVGVLPQSMADRGIAYPDMNETHVTPDMRSRKEKMDELSDAFIALPGGFGTLEELFESITLKQLGYHNKPIVIVNIHEFYSPLFEMIEHLFTSKFAKASYRGLYDVALTPDQAMAALAAYRPAEVETKYD